MWSVEDIKKLRTSHRYKNHRERVFYPHLARWIKEVRKTSTVYADVSELGIDVLEEITKDGSFIGYEVKVPQIKKDHLDYSSLIEG